MTGFFPTSVAGSIRVDDAFNGGLNVTGISDTATSDGISLTAVIGSVDPVDSVPAVLINGMKKNTTGAQALGALETVAQFSNWSSPLVTILGSGNVGVGTVNP